MEIKTDTSHLSDSQFSNSAHVAREFSISKSVCEIASHPGGQFFFIIFNGSLIVCDKNITNCIASARGSVGPPRKSRLATACRKTDSSLKRPHAILREREAGGATFFRRRGTQPRANCVNCSFLSCEK